MPTPTPLKPGDLGYFEQSFHAQDILDALNKPGGEEAIARLGWDVKDLRRAAMASLSEKKTKLKPGESWLQAKVQTKDKAKWVRAAQKLKQNLSQWVIETLNKAEK